MHLNTLWLFNNGIPYCEIVKPWDNHKLVSLLDRLFKYEILILAIQHTYVYV